LLLLAGCGGPKILEFSVTPRFACPGDSVQVHFRVKGTPSLETVRHGGPTIDTTTYVIIAELRGKKVYSRGDVVSFGTGFAQPLAFSTTPLGGDSIVARETLDTTTWPAQLRIGLIRSDSARRLTVRHGGKQVVLLPGQPASPALQGLVVSGAWEISSAILGTEIMGDPQRHPPGKVYLGLTLSCEKGPPQ
jgi:hypothetical protein